jgi:hypothetical protein
MAMTEGEQRWAIFNAGVHTRFNVPGLRPVPGTIADLPEPGLRQQAADTWNAAQRLIGVITLWGHFLMLGLMGRRLDEATEDCIRDRFPDLQDMGAVLNALATDPAWEPALEVVVREFDRLIGVRRGTPERYRNVDIRLYRGRRLVELVESFRESMATHLHCLLLNSVTIPFLQRPAKDLHDELVRTTRLNLDLTGDGPPVDFAKAGSDEESVRTRGKYLSELWELAQVLEQYPHTVLRGPAPQAPARPGRSECLTEAEANIKVREYLLKKPSATRDEIAEAIPCSKGLVSKTPAWKRVAEERRKRRPSRPKGKKLGLDIAIETIGNDRFQEQEREEKHDELPTVHEGLSPDDTAKMKAMTPEQRAACLQLMAEQEREQRSEQCRRGRRRAD